MQRHRTSARARRAGIAVIGISVLAACGLQRTGVQGTLSASALGQQQADASTAQPGPEAASTPAAATSAAAEAASSGPTAAVDPVTTDGSGALPTASVASTTKAAAKTSASGLKGGSKTTSPASAATAATKLSGTLTVSLVHVGGFSELAAGIPGISIPAEGTQAESDALMNYVNAHGGIAGKALKTVYYDYNAQQASQENETSECMRVEGLGAFAAVIGGQIQPSTRGCYAADKILTFEGSTYGMPKSVFDAYNPYYFAMSYPTYDEEEKAKISSLCARKWFNAGSAVTATTKVGIAYWNDPVYAAVFKDVTTPALEACGFLSANIVGSAVADGDIQSIETGLNTAAAAFSAQGAKHVMFIGSAPLQPFFVEQEGNQGFIYGVSSFDEPLYEEYNAASSMAGAEGIGFDVDEDVDDSQVPFPQPGIETTCVNIYKAEGITFQGRYSANYNAKEAMQWCQAVVWLTQVANEVGPKVTTTSWAARADTDPLPFTGVFTFGSKEGAGDHSWDATYRDWAWDPSCSCGKYTSGVNSIG